MSVDATKPVCGIVMPLSAIEELEASHWMEVREIIEEAIEVAGFEPNLVSDSDDVGVIQKRIIQNLYENPVVVCDVSAKNPNVMFELGLRLAFDKPTIIVKDDHTQYSFDTAPIEHIGYPRDLRHSKIVNFKDSLAEKIKATYKKSQDDSSYTTFLKHFGPFTVAKLEEREVSGQEFILEQLQIISSDIRRLQSLNMDQKPVRRLSARWARGDLNACMIGINREEVNATALNISAIDGVRSASVEERTPKHCHIVVDVLDEAYAAVSDKIVEMLQGKAANVRGYKDGRSVDFYVRAAMRSSKIDRVEFSD